MTKFATVLSVFIFNHLFPASHFHSSPNTKDSIQQLNEKILATIDDVLVSLRIDKNFTKPKNVQERFLIHNFIQNVSEKNHKKYKEIHNLSKAYVSNNKTAYFIFIINEVFEEIITRERSLLSNTRITVTNKSNNQLLVGKGLTVNFTEFNRKVSKFIIKDIVFKLLFANPKKSYEHEEAKYLENWATNITRNLETRRIYKGQPTSIEEFPFMASIHIAGQFSCAGVIVSKDLIITAASCLRVFHSAQRTPHISVMVRVGSNFTSKYGRLIAIAEMHFHPQYDHNTLTNNLVILKLAKRLNFNKKIRMISYDTKAYKLPENVDNILILGWGAKNDKENYHSTSQPISYALVDVYNLEECKNIYSRFYVKDKHFCTGYASKGSGACNNDIGGPAIVGSSLTGVISFGSPFCGRPDAPTVFTKLGYYAKWITNIIKGNQKQFLRQQSLDDPNKSKGIDKEIDTLTELIGELQVAKHINKSVDEIIEEVERHEHLQIPEMNSYLPEFSIDSPFDLFMPSEETTTPKTHQKQNFHNEVELAHVNETEILYGDNDNYIDKVTGGDLIVDPEDDPNSPTMTITTTRKGVTTTTTEPPLRSTKIGDDFLIGMTISTESESTENRRSSMNPIAALVTRKTRSHRQEHSKIEIKVHHDLALHARGGKKNSKFEIVFWNGGTTQRFPEFPQNRKSISEAIDSTETESEY